MKTHRSTFRIATRLLALMISTLVSQANAAEGLRFNSAGVLDLADRAQLGAHVVAATGTLASTESASILAAPPIVEEPLLLQFSDDIYGCKTPSAACSSQHEKQLIDANSAIVKRVGKHLTITPAAGKPLEFIDWKRAETKTADGDEENHLYIGKLAGSGYQRIEVQFGHDAPGNFLINAANGKIAFVHNAADVVAPSPDGLLLLTFNTMNPPFSVRVASLDASGPRLVLQCAAAKDDDRLEVKFKGWHDAHSFDLALESHAPRSKLAHALALRLTSKEGAWSLATTDTAQLAASALTCTQ